jgi:hypothetical protein
MARSFLVRFIHSQLPLSGPGAARWFYKRELSAKADTQKSVCRREAQTSQVLRAASAFQDVH